MDLYRRIAAIRTDEDASDLLDEMLDRYGEAPKSVLALLDVALLRSAAAKAGVSDISQKGSLLRLQLGVFHPQALVAVCGHAKYRQRLTLAAGEIPALTLKLKPGEDGLEAARDLGANSMTVFRRVILPLSLPGVISGITMVFVPSVSTFAISRMLGGGTELLLGDLIERQFLGGAYNPQLGAAISLVMMIIVLVCMLVMNRFGEGEEQAVML